MMRRRKDNDDLEHGDPKSVKTPGMDETDG